MSRRNAPRLIDPALDLQGHELRHFGVPSTGALDRANERTRRAGLAQPRSAPAVTGGLIDGTALASLLAILSEQGTVRNLAVPGDLMGLLSVNLPDVLINSAVTNSTVTFGTSLTTLVSTTVGPLVTDVDYLLVCVSHARLSVDTTGFAVGYARTQASSSSVAGQQTGTVGGERSCVAVAFESVTGAGSSVTMSARANMTTSTGSSAATLVLGLAFPLNLLGGA